MIKVVTIAGSDASGGAGLEADLKTFEEYGLYGMAAVTLIATMDPNNNWAHTVFAIPETVLVAQFETIFRGIKPTVVKSGMLGSFYAVELTKQYLMNYNIQDYVLDPVMVCKGADEALNPELNQSIAKNLVPLARVVTPNLFEASQLACVDPIESIEEMKYAAQRIYLSGASNVFIKGGSKLKNMDEAIDIFYNGKEFTTIKSEMIKTTWTHGAGCTTAAAIAAGLARGLSPLESVLLAKKFITQSLRGSFSLNEWVGPGNPSKWRFEKGLF